jgi:hypothetical protein
LTDYRAINFARKFALLPAPRQPRGVPNTGDQGGERTAPPNDVWI